jgi:hypothetical protein
VDDEMSDQGRRTCDIRKVRELPVPVFENKNTRTGGGRIQEREGLGERKGEKGGWSCALGMWKAQKERRMELIVEE